MAGRLLLRKQKLFNGKFLSLDFIGQCYYSEFLLNNKHNSTLSFVDRLLFQL